MLYSAQFNEVSVSAEQDLFELVAPSDAVVVVHQIVLSQRSDVGDAQEEGLNILLRRGATTSGSGGSSATPASLQAGSSLAGSTVEVNNTTKAQDGTIATLHAEAWNVRSPFIWLPPPELRIYLSPGQRLTVELDTVPNDAIVANGVIYFEELGG
ncbi:hypothetical protein [Actinomadura sp. 21ATH]|uniref:hypothetical protein n=1 Tax=Actinomadura sp. 21ATH TaxID=1735444 RepID=UPI0035C005F5